MYCYHQGPSFVIGFDGWDGWTAGEKVRPKPSPSLRMQFLVERGEEA
jgi:hypothetical protein